MFYLKPNPMLYTSPTSLNRRGNVTIFPKGKATLQYTLAIILSDLVKIRFIATFEYNKEQMIVVDENDDLFIISKDQFYIVPEYSYETNEVN